MGIPKNVRRFEFLSYLAGLIFITTLPFVDVPITLAIFIGNLIWCAFIVFLIWSTARRRKNWARWLILSLFIFEAIELSFVQRYYDWSASLVLIRFTVTAIEALALYFVFTGDSNQWFRGGVSRADPMELQ